MNFRPSSFVFILALASSTNAIAEETEQVGETPKATFQEIVATPRLLDDYPDSGVQIGQGWNSLSAQGTSANCVDVSIAPIENSDFRVDVSEIKSRFSLSKSKSVFARASGGFGGFSGSASYDSSSSTQINSEHLNLLFEVRANLGSTSAIGGATASELANSFSIDFENIAKLSPEAQRLVLTGLYSKPLQVSGTEIKLSSFAKKMLESSPENFSALCGEGFVSEIYRGTFTQIVATYQSTDRTSQETLKATLSASGFGVKAKGGVTVATDMKTYNDNTRFSIFQKGGEPIDIPANFDQLKEIIRDSNQFVVGPVAHSVGITPYTSLSDYREVTQQDGYPDPSLLAEMSAHFLVLSDLYDLVTQIYLEDLESTDEDKSRLYEARVVEAYGGQNNLTSLRDQLQNDMDYLRDSISRCYAVRAACSVSSAKLSSKLKEKGYIEAFRKQVGIKEKDFEEALKGSSLQSFTEQLEKLETSDNATTLSRNILEEAIATQELNSKLGADPSEISPEFYLSFYQYLLQIPLPSGALSSVTKFDESFDVMTPEAEATKKEKIKKAVNNQVLLMRLLPWKEYFCGFGQGNHLCVSDEYLSQILKTDFIDKLISAATVDIWQCEMVEVISAAQQRDQCERDDFYGDGIDSQTGYLISCQGFEDVYEPACSYVETGQ